MLKKILKKLFVLKTLSKKQVFSIFVIITIFALFYPVYQAHAVIEWGVLLATAGIGIGIGVVSKIVGAIVGFVFLWIFSSFILSYGNAILSWAVTSPFQMSFTNPANNIIIELGWTLLRDFTNMLFVLGLAYIGLATALNIAGFDTKKTFINLLLIALLINFTPVICGAIVDISNIVTDFFLQGVNFDEMVKVVKDNFNIPSSWWETLKYDKIEYLAKLFISMFFNLFAGVILFAFALLFIGRHIAIWLLVITSPLAFFAYIFDRTRKHFQTWWRYFLGWSIAAIPAGFFLYLGNYFANEISEGGEVVQTAMLEAGFPMLGKILPHVLLTIFLYGGIFAVRKMTPAGANVLMALPRKFEGAVTGFGKKHLGKLKTAVTDIEGGRKRGERIQEEIKKKRQAAKAAGKSQRWAAFEGVIAGGGAEVIKGAFGVKPQTRKESLKEARESAAFDSNDELKETISRVAPKSAQYGVATEELIKRDDFDFELGGDEAKKIIDNMRIHHPKINILKLRKSRVDLSAYLEKAKTKKYTEEIARNNPHLTSDLVEKRAARRVVQKRVQKIDVESFAKDVQGQAYDSTDVLSGMDEQKVKHIGEKGSEEKRNKLKQIVGSQGFNKAIQDATNQADMPTANRLLDVKAWVDTNPNF